MTRKTERRRIECWRARRLEQAGFRPGDAEELARRCGYDLHALIELVERGCPPQLALRILAPLDGDERPC